MRIIKRKNAGFTLLELVVVVGIMGLMSTMAMDLYTDKSNQKRYELTKQRLAEIKFAIIGDPMMKIGNQRVLSGFYHDVNRLPVSITELIYQCTSSISGEGITATSGSECTSLNGTWVGDNWNGPYLTNIQANGDALVFRDGWGNDHTDGNFGWIYDGSRGGTAIAENLWIKSLGLDRAPGGSTLYEVDYPSTGNLINKADLDTISHIQGLASDSISISAVNTNALTHNENYCLVINFGSITYISDGININLEQNQPNTISFSNFVNHASGSIVSVLPHGDYTFKFYEDSVATPCPGISPAAVPTTDASKVLYIKGNGDFATLKVFS